MIRPPKSAPETPSLGVLMSRQAWWIAERRRCGAPVYSVARVDAIESDSEAVLSTLRALEVPHVHGLPIVAVVVVEVTYRAGATLRPWSARAILVHDLIALRAMRDLADLVLEPMALERESWPAPEAPFDRAFAAVAGASC